MQGVKCRVRRLEFRAHRLEFEIEDLGLWSESVRGREKEKEIERESERARER